MSGSLDMSRLSKLIEDTVRSLVTTIAARALGLDGSRMSIMSIDVCLYRGNADAFVNEQRQDRVIRQSIVRFLDRAIGPIKDELEAKIIERTFSVKQWSMSRRGFQNFEERVEYKLRAAIKNMIETDGAEIVAVIRHEAEKKIAASV